MYIILVLVFILVWILFGHQFMINWTTKRINEDADKSFGDYVYYRDLSKNLKRKV